MIPQEHIAATFISTTPEGKTFLDALPNVPEPYRSLSTGIPAWADELGMTRRWFALLVKVGLASVRLQEPQSGVYVIRFKAPGFEWQFAMIPEIAYAMCAIIHRMIQSRYVDMSIEWRGQTLYIPYELARRFLQAGAVAVHGHEERCKLFHDTVFSQPELTGAAQVKPVEMDKVPPPAPAVTPDKGRAPSETELQLLQAGAMAYKQYRSFRTAFYISVAGNIIMFYYVMQTTGAIVR